MKELRAKNKNVLLLDGGDSFDAGKNVPELRAETSTKVLGLMKYDGLNIADGELSLGLNFFEKLKGKAKFPLLSANLYKNKKPLGEKYIIKKFDGVKVGVIGLVSPTYFNPDLLAKGDLNVKDPEDTLNEILPAVKAKADIIVLLSHLGRVQTRALIQNVPGFDVAIIGHELGIMNQPEMVNKTIIVQNSMQGKFFGILNLTLEEKGGIQAHEVNVTSITEKTPSDPEVLAIINEFIKKRDLAKAPETGNLPANGNLPPKDTAPLNKNNP